MRKSNHRLTILRIFCAVLGLVVISSRAQESPTVPATRSATVVAKEQALISPPVATISPEKLSDPQEIARALASGKAKVIVMLSPPAALARTDFASKASRGVLRAEIKKLQQDVLDRVPANDVKAGHRFDNIAGFSAEVSASGLKALQAHPQVALIEPVVMLKAHLAQGISLMHGMTHRSTYNGAGMAIAICDSGVDYNHPRLGGGGFPNSKVIGGYNFGDNSSDPAPQGESHGTACAGIAAGSLGTVGDYIGGVAYNSKIYALKITSGPGGNASTADIAAAWDWCVTHKEDDPNNPIMVISTSFGGGQYFATCDTAFAALTTAANNAVAAGITVLASSGNEGYCNAISAPSCITSVISVGAVYDASFGHYLPCIEQDSCAPKISTTGCATGWYADDTTAADKVTSYANVAPFLTLLAPGNQCYTLDIVGSAGYSGGDYFSAFGGTSASCPYAAGAVACLQSAARALTGNYLTPQEIRNRLTATGDNITDTKVAITRPRVNLERAFSPGFNVVSATLIGGNGNQSVDPNECDELRVVLRNDGFATASNIFATLTASIPGLSVVQQSSSYPNLAPGATGTNVTLFRFSTSPLFVCGALVNFALSVTSSGSTNVATFSLISGSTNYIITQSGGASITAGTTDIGNHGDDTITSIALPFAFTFYGQAFSNAAVSDNGSVQFMSASSSAANSCLPVAGFASTIFAFWDDLRTDGTIGTAQGIFTSISGVAPNRIFNIEWRASYYHPGRKGSPVNFEVRLYENLSRFDLVYGTLNGNGSSATVGSQKEPGAAFTEFECNSGGLSSGLQLAFQTVCTDGGGGECGGAPIVNFMGSPTNGILPMTVFFTNFTTGATSYSWNFGDGHTSTATNPANSYSNAGNYSVTLTAVGPAGTNALTRTNYIAVYATNALPAITNQPQNLTVNQGQNATFSVGASGLSPLSYQWRFNGTNIAGATASSYTRTAAQCAHAGSYQVVVANSFGGTTSSVALLSVVAPPSITGQPQSLAVIRGENATFNVTASAACGDGLTYQWRFNSTNISGAIASSLTLTNVQPADAGSYTVIVTNSAGSITSTVAALAVHVPPSIAQQPQSQTVNQGSNATFTVTASGTTPLAFQWRFNTTNIAGATTIAYTRTNAQPADAGSYTVVVTNVAGSVTSVVATLEVTIPPPVADFTAEPTNGVAPLVVVFTNLSAHATDFAWDFGDGHTSTNASPTNVYNSQGSYTVTLTVRGAGGTNTLAQTNYIVLSNSPPMLATISNQIVIEETLLTLTAVANDADANQHLTFSLDTNAPAGAQINSTNGVFTWTPTHTQADSTNEITAIATDDGAPPLRATRTFTVIVLKTNHAPVLAPIADRTVHAGTTVIITNAATDPDIPPDTLTFSLDPGAPPASFIDPVTGIFTWTPDNSHALTTNAITARVSDNGAPSMSDAKTFTITVMSQPEILSVTLSNEVATIVWSAIVGQGYRLQFKGDLNETNWSDALPDVIATESVASKDNSLDGVAQRYYRILVR